MALKAPLSPVLHAPKWIDSSSLFGQKRPEVLFKHRPKKGRRLSRSETRSGGSLDPAAADSALIAASKASAGPIIYVYIYTKPYTCV